MSSRFWTLVVSIYGIALFGLMFLDGSVLVLTLPLLIYLGAAILFAPDEAQWEISRQVSSPVVEQGESVRVKVLVTNTGRRGEEILLEDLLPLDLTVEEGKTRWLVSCDPGETVEYEYTVCCTRGRHTFKRVILNSGEYFGLFERSWVLQAGGEFQSVPEVPHLGHIEIRPRQTRGFAGPIPARQSGVGMSFFGVREYQMGDSLRRVNWKVSARNELGLYTNQFEQERIADVGLILDARSQTNLDADGRNLFEYSVQAAAALADSFLADGHRVSLLTYGFGMQRVFPGYGKIQRYMILRALTQAEVGSNFALESLHYLPTRLFPARSQLVMISPLGAKDYSAFARLCQDGYEVMLVSPNPVLYELQMFAQEGQLTQQANRLAHLERSLLLRKLTRLGVVVVDWDVRQPFEQAMHRMLGRQRQFRRNLRGISRD